MPLLQIWRGRVIYTKNTKHILKREALDMVELFGSLGKDQHLDWS